MDWILRYIKTVTSFVRISVRVTAMPMVVVGFRVRDRLWLGLGLMLGLGIWSG